MLERDLLHRIAEQDESALQDLYRLYYQRLTRFLFRLVFDPQLVGEVINDVFLVVWQKAGNFRGDSSPSTWIMGIAYNKALKANKRHKPQESLALAEDLADESSTGLQSEVFATVNRLSPKHRAVIVLTYQFGYSYKEISQILGCPENTVKTRMHYARKSLQTLMET